MDISVLEGSLTLPVRPSYKDNVEVKHCNDIFGCIKGGEFLANLATVSFLRMTSLREVSSPRHCASFFYTVRGSSDIIILPLLIGRCVTYKVDTVYCLSIC
jgi:hypothetical protein